MIPFLHLVAGAGIGAGMFVVVRWIGRQSPAVQALVAGGLLARAAIGVSLFWISYLRLPVLRSLQLGAGFWSPVHDARTYFDIARLATERGLSSIAPDSPSPFFTKVLAVWMQVVGVSPSAGMLLNLCVYVGCCALLTRLYRPVGRWRPDLPLVIAVAAISFCPVLVIDSSQPLKDDVFFALVVLVCAATMLMFRSMAGAASNRLAGFLAALCGLACAIHAVAGIRPYYPAIVLICLAPVLTGLAVFSPSGQRLRRASTGALVLGVVWLAYSTGARIQVRPSEERHTVGLLPLSPGLPPKGGVLRTATSALTEARRSFVDSGGNTNTAADPTSILGAVGTGLAMIVVPISILEATSLVSFSGGERSLLLVTNADTVFMDCSLIGIGVMVFRRRRLIGDRRAFVWFGLILGTLTAVLLGYVVTNFGTLFRLRYLLATPLWMLALAVSPDRVAHRGGR